MVFVFYSRVKRGHVRIPGTRSVSVKSRSQTEEKTENHFHLSIIIHPMRILIVEDDRHIAQNIREFLEQNTFSVDVSHSGEEGFRLAMSSTPYDCIILDRMLPDKEGVDVCRDLRTSGIRIPIIILTAKDATDAKIEGLDAGADDYLVKPFSLRELFSRVNALIRRSYDNLSEGI